LISVQAEFSISPSGQEITMPTRVALYARVSKTGQTIENQLRQLRQAARRHGWQIVAVFKDEFISGTKGRIDRGGYDALCQGIARREFDMVASWSVCRLGRSLQELIGFLVQLRDKRVDLYLHLQGLDTSTAAGRALYGMLSVFAEFERAMIVDRIRAGLERAKEAGKRLGRPRIASETEAAISEALASGQGIRRTAAKFGVGTGTVQRIAAQRTAA
jgi:DNA invertase Pin-like site-specific DNA recombinase